MKMAARTVKVSSVFPHMGIFEGVVVSRKGHLTVGWEMSLPPVYSCTEPEYDDVLEAFASAVRVLPAWTVVHRQDIYLRRRWQPGGEPKGFLGSSYDAHFKGRPYLEHRSYVYLTFGTKDVIDKAGKQSGLFGIDFAARVPDRQAFAQFANKAEEFATVIENSGRVTLRRMTEEDWFGTDERGGAVHRFMMLGDDSPVLSDVVLSPDRVGVYDRELISYVIADSDTLPMEMRSVNRVEGLSSTQNAVYLSIASKLGVLLDCEHVVNHIVVVPDQNEIRRRLDREYKLMLSGISSHDNRANAAEVEEYLEDAYRKGLWTVQAHVNVMVWGQEEDLPNLRSRISAAISAMGMTTAVYNRYNTPVLWYACIPGNAAEISRENVMKMELRSSLALAPYETFWSGIPGGRMLICDRMRNIPVRMDLKYAAAAAGLQNNYNIFVLGGSGTGKSYFMNFYLRNCYDAGEHVFVIDVGHSYEGTTRIIAEETGGRDGAYMTWDMEHPISFNPFVGISQWLDANGNLDAGEPGVNSFVSFLETVYTPALGWTSSNEAILKQTVCDFVRKALAEGYGEERLPVLDDYYAFLGKVVSPSLTRKAYAVGDEKVGTAEFNVKDFRLSLKAYSKTGEFGFLLNTTAPPDLFSNRWTVFEVSKLAEVKDKKFYSVCILYMMTSFEAKMRDVDSVKTLCIEEAWKAIANETMEPFLNSLWKTARKSNVSAVVVTQELDDIRQSKAIKDTILMNSDVRVLLDQSNNVSILASDHEEGEDDIRRLLGLSRKDVDLLLSVNKANNPAYRYKEVFVKWVTGPSMVFAVEASPEESVAYESNQKKKKPFFETARECGSFIRADKAIVRKMGLSK